MNSFKRRQLVPDSNFIVKTKNAVELGALEWMLSHSINDTNITYNGKPLSTLYEENKATHLTNTSTSDMNSEVLSPRSATGRSAVSVS
jgi:hypothetical protein